MATDVLYGCLATLAVFLTAQSLFSAYLMLYTWNHPDRLEASRGPTVFVEPTTRFTILLPARHEQAVIYDTILQVMAARYPHELMEVVLICSADDTATIAEGERAIRDLGWGTGVRIAIFDSPPINKPHGLNVGLARSSFEVVTIFDSEDNVHPDIFNVVNTLMQDPTVGIVQGGVQLMNLMSHWFSAHNCMEYYFWFKSRLHMHARMNMVPLGGNTVFIRRPLIDKVGGWNEACLTEDADIGLKLSALGEPIRVVYHPDHVTQEETPASARAFIKQRTRWHQGFIQLLFKGTWMRLPTLGQRALAAYTFSSPIVQAVMMLTWPVAIASLLWLRLPVPLVMLSFLPLVSLAFQYCITGVGAYQFCREYGLRAPWYLLPSMAVTFLPFQFMQGIAAVRAVYRTSRGQGNWEKTAHVGAHRGKATPLGAATMPSFSPTPAARTVPGLGFSDGSGVLERVLGSLSAESGAVLVRDEGGETFSVTAHRGLTRADAKEIRRNVSTAARMGHLKLLRVGEMVTAPSPGSATAGEGNRLVLPIHQGDDVVAMLYIQGIGNEDLEAVRTATIRVEPLVNDMLDALGFRAV